MLSLKPCQVDMFMTSASVRHSEINDMPPKARVLCADGVYTYRFQIYPFSRVRDMLPYYSLPREREHL